MYCHQKAVVKEETNNEKSSATVNYSNGHSDVNSLSVDQIVKERIEESLASSVEVVQEPGVDEVGSELDAMSAPDKSLTTDSESPAIDHPIEGPHVDPAANDNTPARLEILSPTDIMATDETAPVEIQPSHETKAPETHVLKGNGHSTTTQETIGTYGMFLNPYITSWSYHLQV